MPGRPLITKEMIIAEVIAKYPATAAVFGRHFGKGCDGCPGAGYEDIDFGSNMHGADIEALLGELNKAAAGQKGKARG